MLSEHVVGAEHVPPEHLSVPILPALRSSLHADNDYIRGTFRILVWLPVICESVHKS